MAKNYEFQKMAQKGIRVLGGYINFGCDFHGGVFVCAIFLVLGITDNNLQTENKRILATNNQKIRMKSMNLSRLWWAGNCQL